MDNNDKIIEDELTEDEVREIHTFGECWLRNYNRFSRTRWEAALRLYAWEKPIVWGQNRFTVPQGKAKTIIVGSSLPTLDEFVSKNGLGRRVVLEHTINVKSNACLRVVEIDLKLADA